MKVGIIPNSDKDHCIPCLYALTRKLGDMNAHPMIPDQFRDCELTCQYLPMEVMMRECDIVVALGGDGTVIHTAKHAAEYGKPVLGINIGQLGFLTGLEMDEMDRLETLKTGDYLVEDRMMLHICIYRAGGVEEYFSLNDAVISKGALSRIIDISIKCNKSEFINYRADGFIFATPTGSTAYSLSAGGPVLDPAIDSILLTPICPHSLTARSILLNSATVVEAETSMREAGEVFLTIDGEEAIPIHTGDRVVVTRAEDRKAKLIRIRSESFYDILKNKLYERR